jgi:hypothetical protein
MFLDRTRRLAMDQHQTINSTHSACDCCVKREDLKPVCKEEVDDTPITCILPVKLEPHTDIDHPHPASHRTTSDMPASMQSGVAMFGTVQEAGDITEVSCIPTNSPYSY